MMVSFAVQFSSPVRSSLLIIDLNACAVSSCSESFCLCLFSTFSSIRFIVSGLTVRCLINSELVSFMVMDMDLPSFFHTQLANLTVLVVEDAPLFSV